ncbi:MAG: penicillin acylase family protein [Oleiphilaceae bacterium]|nr:penicillin acylase family protein [Oleiphilaceae bacterium]
MFKLPKSSSVKIRGQFPDGLSIQRDANGVPHINANNLNDATWGLGYCHAIDRGMQLQFMRILGQGRLCELLDDTNDNLEIDIFFRRMNWQQGAEKELSKLNSETHEWLLALCDGINAGLKHRTSGLMRLLIGKHEPWTPSDIMLTFRMTSYLTLAQTQAESERLFIELIQNGVSDEKLKSLFPIHDQHIDRALIEKLKLGDRHLPLELLWQSAAPRMMASNNWVVSPKRTASGAALMANDPHLEVNRLPNVWYEAAINYQGQSTIGYGMPGLPGLLIGRNKTLSWGATYTFADTVDSWIEDCKEGQYRVEDEWFKFSQREELITRKKHADHRETFYENHHGVLDGLPTETGYYLATHWAPAESGATTLNAAFALNSVSTVAEAQIHLGAIESAWNWVIADSHGDIGYQMSGLCPIRENNWNGFVPGLGWDKSYDWKGFHPIKDLPRSFNPECGYFVTANQDLNDFGRTSPINMPMADHRARRINDLLSQNAEQDLLSTQAIQMDVFSLQAKEFMDVLKPVLEENFSDQPLAQSLLNWDLCYDKDSIAANLFECFYTELRHLVFQDEQISPELTKHLREQTCLFIDFYQNFDRCLLEPSSVWYQDNNQAECFKQAFLNVCTHFEERTWGQTNTFQFTNILLQGKLPLFFALDSKPVSMIGGRATPHQGQLYEAAGRKTSFAASVRIAADMSEQILHTRTAGGVSDNPFSPWYMSEIQGWLDGTFKTLEP